MRGRGLVDRIAGQLTERLGAAELLWSRVSREPYATIAAHPGRRRAARPRDGSAGRRPRRRVDGHRLAGDDGERRPQRPDGCRLSCLRAQRDGRGVSGTTTSGRLDEAIDRGTRRLLELQRPDGIWVGELESNVTMTAQHLFWNQFLGLRTPETGPADRERADGAERDDGTWSICSSGPPDLSASSSPTRRSGSRGSPPTPSLAAAPYISARARGIAKRASSRSLARAARPVAVAARCADPARARRLAAVGAVLRLQLRVLGAPDVRRARGRPSLASSPQPPPDRPARAQAPVPRKATLGLLSDRALAWYAGRSARRAASSARPSGAMDPRPPGADGSWGGIQPPWVWWLIAARLPLGHGFEDADLPPGGRGWEGFMVEDGDRLRPEACQSPVWDTGLGAARAPRRGCPRRPARAPARPASGCSARRCRQRGDWAIRRPELAAGGWAFEYENDLYPDVDDAAVIALALEELGIGDAAIGRGLPTGSSACRTRAAAGALSTPGTRASGSTRSRSATSAR